MFIGTFTRHLRFDQMGATTPKKQDKKKSKNQLRRERAKFKRQEKSGNVSTSIQDIAPASTSTGAVESSVKATRESQPAEPEFIVDESNKALAEMYKDILRKFDLSNNVEGDEQEQELELITPTGRSNTHIQKSEDGNKATAEKENVRQTGDFDKTDNKPLSKRQLKKLYSIPLYVLKSESKRPELIEWMDANAQDPRLFIYLKTKRNSVPVPSHWQSKKSFLSSKRGVERPPFELPDFIKATGILQMRDTNGGEEESTLKQRMRERIQPKVGQLDIDYNKLYDAFFKYQKKPMMLKFGELYTETTNNDDLIFKDKVSKMKVGRLSKRLRVALGMITEDGKIISKLPPWYNKLKQYGPPPSYPYMNIDTNGKITIKNTNEVNIGPPVVSKHWGTVINDLDESDEEGGNEEANEEDEANKEDKKNKFAPEKGDIMLKTFGETPQDYSRLAKTTNNDQHPPKLYQVLTNKPDSKNTKSIFGQQAPSYQL